MNKKKDTDCLMVFVLALIICGLNSVKTCQENKEDSLNEKTTTRILLSPPSSQHEKTEVLRLPSSDAVRSGGDFSNDRNDNRERVQ